VSKVQDKLKPVLKKSVVLPTSTD